VDLPDLLSFPTRRSSDLEDLMKKFSGQLKDNLKKSEEDSKLKKLLEERLERQELEAKKNEKLLEELNELAEKLDKDELAKRLERSEEHTSELQSRENLVC